jgi:hypothetical protein
MKLVVCAEVSKAAPARLHRPQSELVAVEAPFPLQILCRELGYRMSIARRSAIGIAP